MKELRSFGLVVGGAFGLIGAWPGLRHGLPPRLWALALGGALAALGVAWPRSLTHPYRWWMAAAEMLGAINTRVILGVLFYGLFTPLALILRLLGKDPMRRALAPEADSYRVARHPRDASHMWHQF